MYNLPGSCPADFRLAEWEPSISDETMPKPRFHITRIFCMASAHSSRWQVCNTRSCLHQRNHLASVFDTPAGLEEEPGWNTWSRVLKIRFSTSFSRGCSWSSRMQFAPWRQEVAHPWCGSYARELQTARQAGLRSLWHKQTFLNLFQAQHERKPSRLLKLQRSRSTSHGLDAIKLLTADVHVITII